MRTATAHGPTHKQEDSDTGPLCLLHSFSQLPVEVGTPAKPVPPPCGGTWPHSQPEFPFIPLQCLLRKKAADLAKKVEKGAADGVTSRAMGWVSAWIVTAGTAVSIG